MKELLSTYEEKSLVPPDRKPYRQRIMENQIIRGFVDASKHIPYIDNGLRPGTDLDLQYKKGYGMYLDWDRNGKEPQVPDDLLDKQLVSLNQTMREVMQDAQR